MITVDRSPNGPDVNELESLLKTHRPRVYLTTGVLQNPTSHSFTCGQSFRLLQLAAEHHLHIIEEDLFGDLHLTPPSRLAALAGLEMVTYVSGFSRTLTANGQVGFVAASPHLAAALTHQKLMSGSVTSELLEQIVYRMLSDGSYGKHLHRIKPRLLESTERVSAWLKTAGCVLPYASEGGMFLWAKLGEGMDGESVAMKALEQNMVLAPGTLFGRGAVANNFLRFNVAHSDNEHVRRKFMKLVG